ncbi:MAG: helix-turn-helix domain-containing protein, partial [Patescibacteria group bacterium]
KTVSTELTLSPDLSIHLSTPELREFITISQSQVHTYGPLQLKSEPTAQDISILDLFIKNVGNTVTRDQVAVSIWGKRVSDKYSDWAIDKAISRIKAKIESKQYRLLTVKNLGYKLICQTN